MSTAAPKSIQIIAFAGAEDTLALTPNSLTENPLTAESYPTSQFTLSNVTRGIFPTNLISAHRIFWTVYLIEIRMQCKVISLEVRVSRQH